MLLGAFFSSQMSKIGKTHIVALCAVLFSVLLSSFGLYFYQIFFAKNILLDKPAQKVLVTDGMSLQGLARQLSDDKVIEDVVSFAFVGRILGYDKHIKPGYYVLSSNASNLRTIKLLRSGKQVPIRFSFHGFRQLDKIAPLISSKLQLDEQVLLKALCSDSVAMSYGFNRHTFALMFIPNTYEFYWTTRTTAFLDRMKWEYDRFWNTKRKKQAAQLNLSPIEVGILAAIVQAETNKEDEKSRIAGVYLNRLRARMPLCADPTLIFAWKAFSTKRVLNRHKTIRSPYNTYRNRGLPPGPINLPELSSLEAVLATESHRYFYFCAKPNFSGYHVFSKNARAHQYHARRYQRSLRKKLRAARARKSLKP